MGQFITTPCDGIDRLFYNIFTSGIDVIPHKTEKNV